MSVRVCFRACMCMRNREIVCEFACVYVRVCGCAHTCAHTFFCVCSMGPDTASTVMAAHGFRQALGGAGPLLVGIKAGGIWLQRSSKNSK